MQVYLNNFFVAACGLGLFGDARVQQDITVFGRGGVNEKGGGGVFTTLENKK